MFPPDKAWLEELEETTWRKINESTQNKQDASKRDQSSQGRVIRQIR